MNSKETRYSWTEDRIKSLNTLWQEGLSATEIARELGTTRNAVLGKVHRLKIAARDKKKPIAYPVGRQIQATRHGTKCGLSASKLVRAKQRGLVAQSDDVIVDPDDKELPDITDRIGVLEHRHGHGCSWIIGDPKAAYSYCEQPVKPGSVWCPFHHKKAFAR